MQLRRRRHTAAALVATVIGSVLGNAPGAVAVPDAGLVPAGPADSRTASNALPSVWPKPQSMTGQGRLALVTATVALVAGEGADPYALGVIRSTLRDAGAQQVRDVAPGRALPAQGLVVYADGAGADGALHALGAADRGDLPPGGYRLAVGRAAGRDVVALSGVGADGLFHAAQTLRQLVVPENGGGHSFAGAVIRDWPAAATRGIVEGFYGQSWTVQQRLAQLDFMGRTKQDFYLYAPGDDPYRQEQWREPYPAAARDDFRALAERARRNHITLGWAISPGQSLCFSSADDVKALLRKLDAMWALGVRTFQLQFQDVSYTEWNCSADAPAFGVGPQAAARAQAAVAGAVAAHLAQRYGTAAAPLSMLPTEYYQDGTTAYRSALAQALPPSVEVAWTGVGVVPATITGGQLAAARAAFRHPLLTMDNYPVNDYAPDRIFLGPYAGRDPAVAATSAGLLANAMQQPSAGRIALFTAADFAWNPRSYQPAQSWQAAINDLAGGDPAAREALGALAGNDAASPLDTGAESAYLRPLISDFWTAYQGADDAALNTAASRLRAAFETMRLAPQRLAGLADGTFATEVRPWLLQLSRYGEAGSAAVDMLLAQRRGDGAAGWRAQLDVQRAQDGIERSSVTVGGGVLGPFLSRALDAADTWTGVRADRPEALTSLGSAGGSYPSLMTDGKDSTYWSSNRPPHTGDWFGVDLRSARRVSRVRIAMGSDDGSPTAAECLRDAVLEYSVDGESWQRAGTYQNQQAITATLPPDAVARYIRLRAASPQPGAVAVRSFDVTAEGTYQPTVSGPASADGTAAQSVADSDPTTAYQPADRSSAGAVTMVFGSMRPLAALTVLSEPDSGGQASVEVRVPEVGWRPLGRLGNGWSESGLRGLRAAAVRISWAAGEAPPAIYAIVPWFADSDPALMTVDRPAPDVRIGGGTVTVPVTVSGVRPEEVRGTLAVQAPKGVRVQAAGQVVVRRGATVSVPVRVAVDSGVKMGAYSVPVALSVGGRTVQQTITVHAVPRTAGPDLVPGSVATASGEETSQFPASAVADGRPDTRWSSPAQDSAWVQVELARPVHLGLTVLNWQDAYASAYWVQVSSDGHTWRTAATVTGGRGGTESIPLDAPDTRFIRIQCDQRATRYGYSLWSIAAYAVASSDS